MFAWKWRTFGFLNFSHYLLLLLSYILSKLDSFPRSTCLAEAILSRRLSSFQPTTRVGYSAKRSLFHIFHLKIQSLRHFQDFGEITTSKCYWWVYSNALWKTKFTLTQKYFVKSIYITIYQQHVNTMKKLISQNFC